MEATEAKQTRAQVLRSKVKVRLALSGAGPLIAGLLKENNIEFPSADWEQISGHWLIATVDDDVVACLMVVPAKPIGLLEFLFSKPSVSFKIRVIAMQKLALQGVATLLEFGCSYISCTVETTNKSFYKALGKYGFLPATNTVVMVKRLKGLQ